jgi:hypothetical protein
MDTIFWLGKWISKRSYVTPIIRRGVRTPIGRRNILIIDDWAFRRNRRYGTIICDLERRRIVTLSPDREVATVRAWLADRPGIKIVSRDRGGGYGEAVAKGATRCGSGRRSLAPDGERQRGLPRRSAQVHARNPQRIGTPTMVGQCAVIWVGESRVVQVGGKDVLLVLRFDRFKTENSYTRARMVSGLTLLQADETERDRWSYVSLVEEVRRLVAKTCQGCP